jgi:hypothetical protein
MNKLLKATAILALTLTTTASFAIAVGSNVGANVGSNGAPGTNSPTTNSNMPSGVNTTPTTPRANSAIAQDQNGMVGTAAPGTAMTGPTPGVGDTPSAGVGNTPPAGVGPTNSSAAGMAPQAAEQNN